MALHTARVSLIVTFDDERQTMTTALKFSPSIFGEDSKKWKKMTRTQRILQNYIAGIAAKVMDLLQKEAE